MNKFKIALLPLLFTITLVPNAWSQKKVLSTPAKYIRPYNDILLNKSKDRNDGRLWCVFSDRNNNETFKSRKGKKVKKSKIGFLEQFYVLKEAGEWVKLVKDPGMDYTGKLSPQHEKYGWMHKSKLLLWTHALIDKETRNDHKVLIHKQSASQKVAEDQYNDQSIKSFAQPDLSGVPNEDLEDFQLFFIYKEQEESLLIGKTSWVANKEKIKEVIIGWVRQDQVIPWKTRVAIEPNWDAEAIRECKIRNQSIWWFSDVNVALQFQKGIKGSGRNVVLKTECLDERLPGAIIRFPLTRLINNNIIECYLTGQTGTPLATKAFIPYKIRGQSYPLFKYVVLLDRVELSELLKDMEDLNLIIGKPDLRYQLRNTWGAIIRRHLGNIHEKEFIEKSLPELTQIAYGLPLKNKYFQTIKYKDIIDSDTFSPEMLKNYTRVIKEKYDQLKFIFNDFSYPYSFNTNDVTYYWIDINLLP